MLRIALAVCGFLWFYIPFKGFLFGEGLLFVFFFFFYFPVKNAIWDLDSQCVESVG